MKRVISVQRERLISVGNYKDKRRVWGYMTNDGRTRFGGMMTAARSVLRRIDQNG